MLAAPYVGTLKAARESLGSALRDLVLSEAQDHSHSPARAWPEATGCVISRELEADVVYLQVLCPLGPLSRSLVLPQTPGLPFLHT